jgi:hypothetical protein
MMASLFCRDIGISSITPQTSLVGQAVPGNTSIPLAATFDRAKPRLAHLRGNKVIMPTTTPVVK